MNKWSDIGFIEYFENGSLKKLWPFLVENNTKTAGNYFCLGRLTRNSLRASFSREFSEFVFFNSVVSNNFTVVQMNVWN